jgi:hypothetical protein
VDETRPRRRSITSIRIRGLAERADSPEQPLGPEVIVPEQVPLRVEFDAGKEPVGFVALSRDERGIWASGEIRLDAWEQAKTGNRDRYDHPAGQWPKLAVGILKPLVENGIITSGKVVAVSLVRENADTSLPPWEVVTDPPGECGKCGTTFGYRDHFLKRDGRWTQEKVPDPFCPHCDDDLEHLYQLTHDLRFCGCGDPEAVYDLVRDLLGLFGEKWSDRARADDSHWREVSQRITGRIGGGDGVYYAVLYLIDGAGLLEHGTSIRSSWLTAKGKHYLGLMRLHEYRDMEGPGGLAYGFPHHDPGKPWDDPSQGVCGPGCRHWEASAEDWQKRELAKGRGEEETG